MAKAKKTKKEIFLAKLAKTNSIAGLIKLRSDAPSTFVPYVKDKLSTVLSKNGYEHYRMSDNSLPFGFKKNTIYTVKVNDIHSRNQMSKYKNKKLRVYGFSYDTVKSGRFSHKYVEVYVKSVK